ncbi:NAD-dependent epimerase/dehydratase family protein [Propionimicrobium sp. PCR01-08-3]|uniref:NAD-dependent epimerase/dehydratase family protein n=1 Tax=Propionimicrobium sp. PCR01-08-3 TaxID=3052086 RepID=UPI00255C5BDA|nr:NAD-dependent epimerase/dehydratase family protein [Propionimicrobium sp. PCR01-08-3]WIY82992.1 NAD-dependent epimerase/dehydratase family protein [Propionimicrobium sp. PCR01-08-3]
MKVLITGGAGFIGSNLVRYLGEQGDCSVRVLDDLSTGRRENLQGVAADFVEGSILDYEAVKEAARGMDSIVHLGAIPSVPRSIANPRASHEANTTGTLNVLEAAREVGVDHVVVASSSSVYGSNPKLPKSEYDWTRPMSPYAVSKQATEGYALAYQFSYGLKTLAFRFFNVYGPLQPANHPYAAVIPKFLDAALNDRPAQVHGDGEQSRDFTYVDTVCSVIHEAVRLQIHSQDPVNLAYGTNTTLTALLTEIEDQLGHSVARQHTEPRTGDVRASQADNSRVKELFPAVKPVGLHDGLAATIAWFKQEADQA